MGNKHSFDYVKKVEDFNKKGIINENPADNNFGDKTYWYLLS